MSWLASHFLSFCFSCCGGTRKGVEEEKERRKIMWRIFLGISAALALFLFGCDAMQVNLITDTHFDPAYGLPNGYGKCMDQSPVLGQEGCDAPPALITSLCGDMSTQLSAHTLVMGDLQRHRFSESGLSLNETIGFLTRNLAAVETLSAGEGPRVALALGNNDMVPNYYFNISGGGNEFIHTESDIMEEEGVLVSEEAAQFRKCGYYLRTVSPDLRVIVLHTLVWCYSVSPPVPDTEADPCGQFQFLNTELEAAEKANSKVIIIGHIPPHMNVWEVLKAHDFRSVEKDMYWKPTYQKRYNDLMERYNKTVTSQFYGHTHLFSLQARQGGVPCFIVPSVTPLYGNNPSYMIAKLDDGHYGLKSLTLRYLSDSSWNEGPHVQDVFGDLSNTSSLYLKALSLVEDDKLWLRYLFLRSGGLENRALFPEGKCDLWCRKTIACSMVETSWDNISSCVGNQKDFSRRETFSTALLFFLVFVLL